MHIIGAGMAGLLAGAMLRHEAVAIHEAQPSLPNNHSAVLRFRSAVVGEVMNIPFREVTATKAVHPWMNPVSDALAYSAKTNGSYAIRSIMSARGDASQRYIAPPNLLGLMADRVQCPIHYDSKFDFERCASIAGHTISTIPMPSLMAALGWKPQSEFRSRRGLNITSKIRGADAFCSLYVPNPQLPFSRISITGDELIIECGEDFLNDMSALPVSERQREIEKTLLSAVEVMGMGGIELDYSATQQQYAKILPIDEDERRNFIMWASREHKVWSLGRFATWRPGLLMDDVVHDVRAIQRLIAKGGESYQHNLKD